MSTTTDAKVLELFNLVRTKQKTLKTDEKFVFHTTCSFAIDPASPREMRKNLHAIQDINELAEIYGFLLRKEIDLTTVAKELGVEIKLNHGDFPISDWKNDIKSRIKQVNLNNELKNLRQLEKKLDALVSVEQRREMELAAIQKELGL